MQRKCLLVDVPPVDRRSAAGRPAVYRRLTCCSRRSEKSKIVYGRRFTAGKPPAYRR